MTDETNLGVPPSHRRAPPTHDPSTTPCQFWVRLVEISNGQGECQYFESVRTANGYVWKFDHADPVDFEAIRADQLCQTLRYIAGDDSP